MSFSIFEKVLKILNIIVTILQVALKAITGLETDPETDSAVKED